jgi:hypothetical protein
MSNHQKWITLDSIIYDFISEAELSQSKYFKLFHLAYRILEDLGLDFFYQVKSVKLPINANKTVTLPADYLQYTKLGVLNGIGELVPLKYNEKLTTYKDISPNRIADTESSNFADFYSFSSPVFYNFWENGGYTNLYGVSYSGLYGGGFKIDDTNGVILLDSTFGYDGLVLEYTASPQEGQDYYVPVQFREAIIAWLAWKSVANVQSKSHMNLGDKQIRRHEYFEARRLAIRKYRPFYLDQAYLNSQDASRLVVKS